MRRMTQDAEEKVADLTPMLDVVFIMLIFFIFNLKLILVCYKILSCDHLYQKKMNLLL